MVITFVHELSAIESVVELVTERLGVLGGVQIALVRLEVGVLAGIDPDALRFCFDVCTRDTSLAGATLDIVEIPGLARCRACDAERAIASFTAPCACGS